jgi:hypothetical protein
MNLQVLNTNEKNSSKNLKAESYFNGAAIIDHLGHEIPITEKMIRQACKKSEAVWPFGPIVENKFNSQSF